MKLIYVLLLSTSILYSFTGLCDELEISTEGVNAPIDADLNTVGHQVFRHGGDRESLQSVSNLGYDFRIQNRHGETTVLFGLKHGEDLDLDALRFISETDSSIISIRDNDGKSALLMGLEHKRPLEMIQLLIELHPETPSIPDNDGNLPLHYAFKYRHPKKVFRLIYELYPEAMFIKNKDGQYPWDYARQYMKDFNISKLLLTPRRINNGIRNRNRDRNQETFKQTNRCQETLSLHRR